MSHRASLIFVWLSSAACNFGPGQFNGQVSGHGLVVRSSALAQFEANYQQEGSGITTTDPVVNVLMSDSNTLCADLTGGVLDANHTYVLFNLVMPYLRSGVSSQAISVGNYYVQDSQNFDANLGGGTAYVSFMDGQCGQDMNDDEGRGLSGLVHITDVSLGQNGSVAGDFNAKMGPQGDAVDGNLNAENCPAFTTLSQNKDYAQLRTWPCE